jgi:vesicular inhibitory amino acid transporter
MEQRRITRASLFDPLDTLVLMNSPLDNQAPPSPDSTLIHRRQASSHESILTHPPFSPSLAPVHKLETATEGELQKSSFAQTVFNAVNIFIGVGLLSIPHVFRVAGLILGPLILFFCAGLSWYTSSILLRAMSSRTGIKTYSDLGELAFGRSGRWFITAIFFFELFSCCVVYIVLVGDTLLEIFPTWDKLTLELIAFTLVMLPTSLVHSLKWLSMGSLVGIVGSMMLGVVLALDAFSKPEAPGSIYQPAPMDVWPSSLRSWISIPLSVGVVMYNYSGGAVMPNLYRDMAQPQQYPRMLKWTYTMVTAWFLLITALGYWMFGTGTLEEITFNISQEPAYNRTLTLFLLCMIVINPLTKFALLLNPIALNLELMLLRPTQRYANGDENAPLLTSSDPQSSTWMHHIARIGIRATIACTAFIVAVAYPNFNGLLAIIGTFFSFTVSAIFPCLVYLRLFRGQLSSLEILWNVFIIALSIIMVIVGLIWPSIIDHVAPEMA